MHVNPLSLKPIMLVLVFNDKRHVECSKISSLSIQSMSQVTNVIPHHFDARIPPHATGIVQQQQLLCLGQFKMSISVCRFSLCLNFCLEKLSSKQFSIFQQLNRRSSAQHSPFFHAKINPKSECANRFCYYYLVIRHELILS